MVLTTALRAADLLSRILPAASQYALADLAGDLWYRAAPRRRRLVATNLARVCGWSAGAPAGAGERPDITALVRQAFREHARYYLEILRVPRYPVSRIEKFATVHDWDRLEPVFRSGPLVLVTAHLGNFEPMGLWLAKHRLRAVVPVEEIRPRALYEFLLARRGANREAVETVPLSKARQRLVAALRAGEIAALIADRDLEGSGVPVSFFGHRTTMPSGPAALAVLTGARVVTGRSLRMGRDRFDLCGEVVEFTPSGNRGRDVADLTDTIRRNLERYIKERPEQWFGAFQQIWPDIAV